MIFGFIFKIRGASLKRNLTGKGKRVECLFDDNTWRVRTVPRDNIKRIWVLFDDNGDKLKIADKEGY